MSSADTISAIVCYHIYIRTAEVLLNSLCHNAFIYLLNFVVYCSILLATLNLTERRERRYFRWMLNQGDYCFNEATNEPNIHNSLQVVCQTHMPFLDNHITANTEAGITSNTTYPFS